MIIEQGPWKDSKKGPTVVKGGSKLWKLNLNCLTTEEKKNDEILVVFI